MPTQLAPRHTRPVKSQASRVARQFEYAIAVIIKVALLYVVLNILDWSWTPFLTEDFNRVIPILRFSIGATILANALYMVYDPVWFKSIIQVGLLTISMIVMARVWQVFPFDFSSYDFPWMGTARAILAFTVIGIMLGIISELVRLVGSFLSGNGH
jgi:hypothetical protein